MSSKYNQCLEAMPLADKTDTTVLAHELTPGEEYRIIISGYSGLYRYCTNILVRCEEITEHSVKVSRLCPRTSKSRHRYDGQSFASVQVVITKIRYRPSLASCASEPVFIHRPCRSYFNRFTVLEVAKLPNISSSSAKFSA